MLSTSHSFELIDLELGGADRHSNGLVLYRGILNGLGKAGSQILDAAFPLDETMLDRIAGGSWIEWFG